LLGFGWQASCGPVAAIRIIDTPRLDGQWAALWPFKMRYDLQLLAAARQRRQSANCNLMQPQLGAPVGWLASEAAAAARKFEAAKGGPESRPIAGQNCHGRQRPTSAPRLAAEICEGLRARLAPSARMGETIKD